MSTGDGIADKDEREARNEARDRGAKPEYTVEELKAMLRCSDCSEKWGPCGFHRRAI